MSVLRVVGRAEAGEMASYLNTGFCDMTKWRCSNNLAKVRGLTVDGKLEVVRFKLALLFTQLEDLTGLEKRNGECWERCCLEYCRTTKNNVKRRVSGVVVLPSAVFRTLKERRIQSVMYVVRVRWSNMFIKAGISARTRKLFGEQGRLEVM